MCAQRSPLCTDHHPPLQPQNQKNQPTQREASGSSSAGVGTASAAAAAAEQTPPPQKDKPAAAAPSAAAATPPAGRPPAAPAAAPAPAPAPAPAAAPAAAAGGDQRPPPGAGGSKQPLTKAERRAKQEAERAAKAAAKAGAGGGQGGKQQAKPAGGAGAGGGQQQTSGAGGERAASAGGGGAAAATAAASGGAATAVQPSDGAPAAATAPPAPPAPAPPGLELFAHLPPYRRATPATVLGGGGAAAPASPATPSSSGGQAQQQQAQQQQQQLLQPHPAVLALALRYADGTVSGGDARCLALLEALSAVIRDYRTPEGRSLRHHLTATVNSAVDLLVRARPLSAPMGAAVKLLKLRIGRLDPSQPEAAAKEMLLSLLAEYAHEKVVYARRVLVQHAVSKVSAGDVVLTYGYSSTVVDALLAAHSGGGGKARAVPFSVVVVDGRPGLEGRAALSRLLAAGVPCTYAALSGLAFVIKQATKVMLGASAVLSNGAVLARAGTASVALAAQSAGVPVLVLTASHKFHERVQLDSITHNELGDPEALAHLPFGSGLGGGGGGGGGVASGDQDDDTPAAGGVSALLAGGDLLAAAPARAARLSPADRLVAGPRSPALATTGGGNSGNGGNGGSGGAGGSSGSLPPRLGLLNLRYDLTPADLVTVVTTEFGHLPPTSVPVILREFTESAADAAAAGGGHGHHHR
jgi:translation initiation factor eIF-2B subunit delta